MCKKDQVKVTHNQSDTFIKGEVQQWERGPSIKIQLRF